MDGGGTADIVFLDFSKAFDRVSHRVLLSKLLAVGVPISLLNLVESFLCGRSMCVRVGGVLSEEREVSSGVPQGTVLGPIFFIIYVNSLMQNVNCDWKAFADDFKLILLNENSQAHSLQDDIIAVSRSSSLLGMKINMDKSVVMHFGRGEVMPSLMLGGVELRVVPEFRDLGVIVDSRLRFHQHIRMVYGRTSAMMGDLLRSTVCRSADFMVTLFISHIRPTIEYCSSVWNVGYLLDVRKLESLQRRWTREVYGMQQLDYPTRLRRLSLFSIRGRLLRKDLIKVWKAFNEHDVGLSDLFEMAQYSGTRGHRYKVYPSVSWGIEKKFFSVRVVSVWNSLPSSIVES